METRPSEGPEDLVERTRPSTAAKVERRLSMRAEKTNSSCETPVSRCISPAHGGHEERNAAASTHESSSNRRQRRIVERQLKVMNLTRADLLSELLAQLLRDVVKQDRVVVRSDVERVGERHRFGRVVGGGEGLVELFVDEGKDGDLLRLRVVVELGVLLTIKVNSDSGHTKDRLGRVNKVSRVGVLARALCARNDDATCAFLLSVSPSCVSGMREKAEEKAL